MKSVQEVADLVNKAGECVNASLVSERLGISRHTAGKRLSRACKENLIQRVSMGLYFAKKKQEE